MSLKKACSIGGRGSAWAGPARFASSCKPVTSRLHLLSCLSNAGALVGTVRTVAALLLLPCCSAHCSRVAACPISSACQPRRAVSHLYLPRVHVLHSEEQSAMFGFELACCVRFEMAIFRFEMACCTPRLAAPLASQRTCSSRAALAQGPVPPPIRNASEDERANEYERANS